MTELYISLSRGKGRKSPDVSRVGNLVDGREMGVPECKRMPCQQTTCLTWNRDCIKQPSTNSGRLWR